jgi:hypothetical protein
MGSQEHAPMLATIRTPVFHYTPSPTKYLCDGPGTADSGGG